MLLFGAFALVYLSGCKHKDRTGGFGIVFRRYYQGIAISPGKDFRDGEKGYIDKGKKASTSRVRSRNLQLQPQ